MPFVVAGACGLIAGVAFGLSDDQASTGIAMVFAVIAVLAALRSVAPAAVATSEAGASSTEAPPAPDPTGPVAEDAVADGGGDVATLVRPQPVESTGEVLDRSKVKWRTLKRTANAGIDLPAHLAAPASDQQYALTRPCAACGATTEASRSCPRCGAGASSPARWTPGPDYSPFPTED